MIELEPTALASLAALADQPALSRRLMSGEYGISPEVDASVSQIIDAVRTRGDVALSEFTARFDGVTLEPSEFHLSADQIADSASRVEPDLAAALDGMIDNVRRFHRKQERSGYAIDGPAGSSLQLLIRPLTSVGVYIPGGLAAYPTTVVMNVVPAQIAGVARIVALTPPGSVENNPAIGYALSRLGVTEVIRLGGAQVVAAAAFGTDTICPVDKIVGPGNAYVAAAKRQVFGKVGIDSIAGPSEVVVVADDSAPARWIAWDLLAQAEHDEQARSILITTSWALAQRVAGELKSLVAVAPRGEVIARALTDWGALVVVPDLAAAVEVSNAIAPEHLQVMLGDGVDLEPTDFTAGAIFWGASSPTALGDYWAGPNHVLPTGGTARYRGPLGVDDFVTATTVVRYTPEAADTIGPAVRLARAEGLFAHAAALAARMGIDDTGGGDNQ